MSENKREDSEELHEMQDATFSYLLFVASRLLEKEKEKKREQHPRFTVSFIDGMLLTVF